MQDNQLFEGVGFLKEISVSDFLLFFVYLAIIFVVKFIVLMLLRKLISSKDFKTRIYPVIEDISNWLVLYGSILFFVFYFSKEKWLTFAFYETEGVEISVLLIIVAVLIVTFASRITKALTRYVMPFVYEQFDVDIGMSYTINRLLYYLVMFLALAISFTTVGLDLTALGVVFSVLGIGIGFGVRNIAANFVSGIIILFERPMEVGEMVEIDGKIGRITKIKLRSTVIETLKEGTLVVPNQYFIEQIVRNRSSAQLYARVMVSVQYGSDTKKIERLLNESALKTISLMEEIPEKNVEVQFIDFRNSALDFQVEVQVVDVEMKENLESRIRHAIAEAFVQNNVKLAEETLEK
ncbi:putative small-conductance mechanosensitive channel [Planococcus sp. PAMC 21323]|uniref:mechanosensitive ion channel family protein n=1 Tax=Planococcus sp. PAMC 21323 TaxID=1526927 RepID=UPI0005712243|nr:mechanosensitive ion channel domain-containing protein [Planococcus sp. PAMC 21323]AIY04800.1 putative small-conductance mechanosensitive channel [Planococcus sp. PAMC 21323]